MFDYLSPLLCGCGGWIRYHYPLKIKFGGHHKEFASGTSIENLVAILSKWKYRNGS